MAIQISAIICTFNRASYLSKAIQSLVNQTLDINCYEILVIDNCSTDKTKQVVTETFARVPNLHYIYEPIQGLSQARNTGWQNAKGEYIAYLDDDAIASPHWLEKILEVFQTVKPQPGVVGGKIEPIWEAPRPSWLSDKLARSLTILDWSETPVVFSDDSQWLAGANIAYPKHLLRTFNGFDVNLGRKGSKLLSCEENYLHFRLRTNGHQIYYHPAVVVKHHIQASRLVKSWHFKRRYWGGISASILDIYTLKLSLSSRWEKVILIIKNDILKLLKNILFLSKQKSEEELFELKCSLLSKLGYVYGLIIFLG
ncbi:MAG: glycosyltransferase [Microcystaceae cyanobacterium]